MEDYAVKHEVYGNFDSVESYLAYLSSIGGGAEDNSIVATLALFNENYSYFVANTNEDTVQIYGNLEVDKYAIGGIMALDVWRTQEEKIEYKKDMSLLLKDISNL